MARHLQAALAADSSIVQRNIRADLMLQRNNLLIYHSRVLQCNNLLIALQQIC
jgi:hypothetical protein